MNQQAQLLKQEQAMPVVVLNRYRNSICYVFGVYQVGFANQPARLRAGCRAPASSLPTDLWRPIGMSRTMVRRS